MFALYLGGSGSGKSELAEALAVSCPAARRYYIATMDASDEESERRIARHRRLRAGKGFTTIEFPVHLEDVTLPEPGTALLECLSNLLANEIYSPEGRGEDSVEVILDGIEAVARQASDLIVVSNDVFEDGAEYAGETERYRRMLGKLHRRLAAQADLVIEAVQGIPVVLRAPDDRAGTERGCTVGDRNGSVVMNLKESYVSGTEQHPTTEQYSAAEQYPDIEQNPDTKRHPDTGQYSDIEHHPDDKNSLVFITGGRYQGKLAWAREYLSRRDGTVVFPDEIWDGADGLPSSWDGIRIFTGLPQLIQKILGEEDRVGCLEEILDRPGLVVITEEMGCGIVPMEASDRRLREEVGRLGCRLAARAGEVYRVVCGIPERLKP